MLIHSVEAVRRVDGGFKGSDLIRGCSANEQPLPTRPPVVKVARRFLSIVAASRHQQGSSTVTTAATSGNSLLRQGISLPVMSAGLCTIPVEQVKVHMAHRNWSDNDSRVSTVDAEGWPHASPAQCR